MSLIQKMMPARSQAVTEKKHKLIADLDEIIAEVYVLKILGKEYELKPITGLQLRELDHALVQVRMIHQRLLAGENVDLDEMMSVYYSFCSLVIADLRLDDLYQMTTKQVNELLRICTLHASNQEIEIQQMTPSDSVDEKKNSLK